VFVVIVDCALKMKSKTQKPSSRSQHPKKEVSIVRLMADIPAEIKLYLSAIHSFFLNKERTLPVIEVF